MTPPPHGPDPAAALCAGLPDGAGPALGYGLVSGGAAVRWKKPQDGETRTFWQFALRPLTCPQDKITYWLECVLVVESLQASSRTRGVRCRASPTRENASRRYTYAYADFRKANRNGWRVIRIMPRYETTLRQWAGPASWPRNEIKKGIYVT